MLANCNEFLYNNRGKTLNTFGKDHTGLIRYTINNQGFRNQHDYTKAPKYAFFGCSSVFGIGVDEHDILTSHFKNSHNYGLAGIYSNNESVINLANFINSPLFDTDVKIIFFWTERLNENINDLIHQLPNRNIINISQGKKYANAINLPPQIDSDVSGTHPGTKTYAIWAKIIKLLLTDAES